MVIYIIIMNADNYNSNELIMSFVQSEWLSQMPIILSNQAKYAGRESYLYS